MRVQEAQAIAEFLVDSGQFMVLPIWKTRQEAIDFLTQQIAKFMEAQWPKSERSTQGVSR
jgi:hypothetical protein